MTLLATVVSLHALPAVIETEPRFPTAWQHLGFIDYIDRTGSAVPDLDARWSWPGFFAVAAFVAKACGVTDFTEVIRWWPRPSNSSTWHRCSCSSRSMRASWRAKWTGIWIFVLSGWVGQDYFSPQGFTYLLYLVFVAILLVWFRAPRVIWTKRRPGEAEVEPTAAATGRAARGADRPVRGERPGPPAHPVRDARRARGARPGRPLRPARPAHPVRRPGRRLVGFMAEPYWSGHFDDLFGGVGGVGGNVSPSVSGRIQGGDSTHKLVLYRGCCWPAG